MRFGKETGAVLLTSALFLSGCSGETPPQPDMSSIAATTPAPEPTPSQSESPSEPEGEADTSYVCSDVQARESNPADADYLDQLIPELTNFSDAELQTLAIDNLYKLQYVTEIATQHTDTPGEANVTAIQNPLQPGQYLSHSTVSNAGTTTIKENNLNDGFECEVSSVYAQFDSVENVNYITVALGETVFQFIIDDEDKITMGDGSPLIAEAVAVMTVLAERYLTIMETFFGTSAEPEPTTTDSTTTIAV